MTDIQEKPLVSFLLFAYNQERFIREAILGAFSQTYSPLEIIISDDCSLDRTYEIIQEEAARYNGPHKILLNRNERNLGIGGHVSHVMSLASGTLVVAAAGDDISLPERTNEIYQAWMGSGMKAFSIGSEFEKIDEFGDNVKEFHDRGRIHLPQEQQLLHFSKTLAVYVHGCTHAWHRKVFDVFGPLPNITCEDRAIPARSMLLGSVVQINKSLIKYRTHGSNLSASCRKLTAKENIAKAIYFTNDFLNIHNEVVRCINEYKCTVEGTSRGHELDQCILNLHAHKRKYELQLDMLTGYPIVRLYSLFRYIFLYGMKRETIIFAACSISRTTYQMLKQLESYCVSLGKKTLLRGSVA